MSVLIQGGARMGVPVKKAGKAPLGGQPQMSLHSVRGRELPSGGATRHPHPCLEPLRPESSTDPPGAPSPGGEHLPHQL